MYYTTTRDSGPRWHHRSIIHS